MKSAITFLFLLAGATIALFFSSQKTKEAIENSYEIEQ
jgi:hypothetical protein